MVYIEVPASLTFRHLLMRALATVCRGLRQPAAFTDAVLSAVGEAFNNAVLHGAGPGGAHPVVEVEVGVEADVMLIRICDYGAGFSLDAVPDLAGLADLVGLDDDLGPLDDAGVDRLPESGMGLFIMRALMAEVDYRPGRPNVLSLRKPLVRAAG